MKVLENLNPIGSSLSDSISITDSTLKFISAHIPNGWRVIETDSKIVISTNQEGVITYLPPGAVSGGDFDSTFLVSPIVQFTKFDITDQKSLSNSIVRLNSMEQIISNNLDCYWDDCQSPPMEFRHFNPHWRQNIYERNKSIRYKKERVSCKEFDESKVENKYRKAVKETPRYFTESLALGNKKCNWCYCNESYQVIIKPEKLQKEVELVEQFIFENFNKTYKKTF